MWSYICWIFVFWYFIVIAALASIYLGLLNYIFLWLSIFCLFMYENSFISFFLLCMKVPLLNKYINWCTCLCYFIFLVIYFKLYASLAILPEQRAQKVKSYYSYVSDCGGPTCTCATCWVTDGLGHSRTHYTVLKVYFLAFFFSNDWIEVIARYYSISKTGWITINKRRSTGLWWDILVVKA